MLSQEPKPISNAPLAGEEEDIAQIRQLMAFLHQQQFHKYGKFFRDQHAQGTGCVKATFTVNENIPIWAKTGIFREPGKTYEAIVRFSNGSSNLHSDHEKTSRGMAIKLLGVEGEKVLPLSDLQATGTQTEQDFLLVNHPGFPFPTIPAYREFFQLVKQYSWLPSPWNGRLPQLIFFGLIHRNWSKIASETTSVKIANPLDLQYWSMSAYRLGPLAMKFSAKLADTGSISATAEGSTDHPDYLFDALKTRLSKAEATFDFMIQPRLESIADKMPIEDLSQIWPQQEANSTDNSQPNSSKFLTVAKLVIPPQEPAQDCQNRAFNPWHSLVEHEPLGGINRLRKVVYQASVARRSQSS